MRNLWLAVILILGFSLRLFWLPQYPSGFTPDEAAFGYNSYSLINTGLDEWGVPAWQLPFTNLRSFGDYKLPLYSFLSVPTVKIFGLTEFAVRLPNALLGVLAIAVIYVFSRRLFPASPAGLLAAFLLAISPWHIQLSRGAFEANLITFFLPLGLALLLSRRSVMAAAIFGLNFYSYHSARYLTPLLLGLTFLIYPRLLTKKFMVILLIVVLPGLYSLVGGGSARSADVAIFHPTDSWASVVDRRYAATVLGLPDPLSRIFSNRPLSFLSLFIGNYVSYFSPQFLFTQGPGEATYGLIPGHGVIYYLELPLLVACLVMFIKHPSRAHLLLFGCLLLAPLPPALAKGVGFAANRAALMAPLLSVMSAVGFSYLLTRFLPHRRTILFSLTGLLSLSLVFFLENYLFHAPYSFSRSMLSGRQQAIQLSRGLFAGFPEIRVSRSLSEPHIYVAFYLAVDPSVYQAAAKGWSEPAKHFGFLDQMDGYRLGKFRFGNLFPDQKNLPPALLIGLASDFPASSKPIYTVSYLDGSPNIQISASSL